MDKIIKNYFDEIFKLLYEDEKHIAKTPEYYQFCALFAELGHAAEEYNLFMNVQTLYDLILTGEALYFKNTEIVKKNLPANHDALMNVCKNMVRDWVVNS